MTTKPTGDLPAVFHDEINQISRKLIECYGLTFSEGSGTSLDEALLRWLDFRARSIEPKPRQIIYSKQFPVPSLPPEIANALTTVEALIRDGGDLNAYQSKSLTLHNDTSGVKRQKRTDGLWADWKIHHLHLTDVPIRSGQTYSARSDWLLFFMVYEDAIALLDVCNHDRPSLFSDQRLIDIYLRDWPEHAERYKLKGVVGLARNDAHTPEETAKLRSAGVTAMIMSNGAVFAPPGGGVTTAATSTRISLDMNEIRRTVRHLAERTTEEGSQARNVATQLGINEPSFLLNVSTAGDLVIGEVSGQFALALPRNDPTDAVAKMHDMFLPKWAGIELAAYWSANP